MVVAVWAGLAADVVAQGSAASDRAALEAVYRATGGDDWMDNTNWLSDEPLDDWYGVEVTDGRVTGLRLGGWDESVRKIVGNGLTGSLPPELGTLSALRWLEAAGNRGLTGPIPAELGNLANLEILGLQDNWLTGSIPAALGRLANLEMFWLHRNALTGSVPPELGNLRALRILVAGQNMLSGPVPPELGNLSSLEDLYLGGTMLSGSLPVEMSDLSALEWLSLDESGLCVPDSPVMRAWVAAIASPVSPSGPADLHVKTATSGDIDADGDTDLWVESSGGLNVGSHFMVNNGDGTFTVDTVRAPHELLHNPHPEYWRHRGNALVDLDNDTDLDLALGQLRDVHPTHINQFSIVLVNDDTGHYPARIELPHPAFYDGYTSVPALAHFDVNDDGFQDLLLVHQRNDDTLPNVIWFSGRYVQVLVNRGGMSFADETSTRMGDQSATTPERNQDGGRLNNVARAPVMQDIDRDGCADLVMSQSNAAVRIESPLVYRNDGSGRFRAMSPVPFVGSSRYFGVGAVSADVNGDGAVDFVVPHDNSGPDQEYGTADDFAMLVTLLNTTPPGPVRCGDPSNRAPAPAGALPDRTLAPNATLNVDVSRAFADPDGDALTYTVSSSAPQVVTARAAGALVTLAAVGEGTATIQVTATDPGGLSAARSFTVTVSTTVSGSFTDDPIQPGVTPVKAVHFTELRTRIDALRRAGGLPAFSWTDRVLRAGVTPVRLVHLLELREGLAAAYGATGRAAPGWTDAAPAVGSAPIRAVHLMELRAAVVALE